MADILDQDPMTVTRQQSPFESNERLRLFVDEAPDCIIAHTLEGRIVDINDQAIALLGYKRDELLALTIADIDADISQNDADAARPDQTRDTATALKTTYQTKDGRGIPVEVRSRVLDSSLGAIVVVHARRLASDPVELASCPHDFAEELLVKTPMIVLVLDQAGTIQYTNPYFEQLSGYRLDEIQGKEWFETFLPPDDRDQIRTLFRRAWGIESTRGHINPILTRKGELLQIEWYDNVLRDNQGEVKALLAIGQDVSERLQVVAELEQSREEWIHAMDTFHDPVYLLDAQRRFVRGNQAFYRMANATEAQLRGRHIVDILHPEGEVVPCPVCRAQEDKRDEVITLEADHPDNPAAIPIEVHCRILRSKGQEPTGIVMSIHDLSRSRAEAERLRESEARLAEAQELAHLGNWSWDIENQSLHWSDEIYRIFGLQPQEFGATYEAFLAQVHPDDRERVQHEVDMALYGMQPYQIDHRIILQDGSVRHVHERGEVRYDGNGDPLRMIGTVQDITTRKESEYQLLKTLSEKEVLLRELHHRVKNNMQVISSLLSLQARHAHSKSPIESLAETRQRIRAMALIHERLYSSTDLSHVDFNDYLRYLSERLARLYHEPGVHLQIEVKGPALRLPVDMALPCALISNELITNAILHAYPADQLSRPIDITLSKPNESHSQICFRDFGVGMSETSDDTEPETLGLIIVRALASQLGGQIGFEISGGTTARLKFPVSKKQSPYNVDTTT